MPCSQILSQTSIFSISSLCALFTDTITDLHHRSPFLPPHPSVPCSQILSQISIFSISSFCALFTDTITDLHFLLLTFLCSVHRYYHRSPFHLPHPSVPCSQILSQISIFSISPFCALLTDTITDLHFFHLIPLCPVHRYYHRPPFSPSNLSVLCSQILSQISIFSTSSFCALFTDTITDLHFLHLILLCSVHRYYHRSPFSPSHLSVLCSQILSQISISSTSSLCALFTDTITDLHFLHLTFLCSVHRYYHRSPFSPPHPFVLCSQILSQTSSFFPSHPSVPCSQVLSQISIFSISPFCALFTDTITDLHFFHLILLCSVHRSYHRSPFSPSHLSVLCSQILSRVSISSTSSFCALFTDTITDLHFLRLILLCSVHRYYHRSPFSPSHLSVLCSQILSQISISSTSSLCALFTDTITDLHFLHLTFLCSVHRYYHRSPFSPPHPFVLCSQILSQISIFSSSPFCALFTDTITVRLPFSFLLP